MVGAGLVPARMAESHDRSSPIGDPGRDKPCPYSYFVTALMRPYRRLARICHHCFDSLFRAIISSISSFPFFFSL